MSSKKVIFVIEMLRYNSRENHSYVGGVFDDEVTALAEAWDHMKMRAGKYGALVTGFELNENKIVYQRELDCWDAFAESCKEVAEEVKKRMISDTEEEEKE